MRCVCVCALQFYVVDCGRARQPAVYCRGLEHVILVQRLWRLQYLGLCREPLGERILATVLCSSSPAVTTNVQERSGHFSADCHCRRRRNHGCGILRVTSLVHEQERAGSGALLYHRRRCAQHA